MAKEEWLIMQLHPVPLTGGGFEFLTQQMFAGLLRGVGIHCYANLAVFPFNPGQSRQSKRTDPSVKLIIGHY